MIKYIPVTLINWMILMTTNYKLLPKMISENPMISYMLGTLYISIMFSMTICVIHNLFKLVIEILCKN